ncbi:DNA cytosine methyltransferase [Nostoc flagelliforme]|uniref:DNA cytosine methyltransferase n=1 Tax=Nostoc flagelliforme TaxID=1306274 RepID=UPI0030DBAD77
MGDASYPSTSQGRSPLIPFCDPTSQIIKAATLGKFADIWLPDGTVKSLSIEGAAKLQGFPDWYKFPNETATAGSIIGYSVPPSFATQLFMSAQSPVESCNCMTNRWTKLRTVLVHLPALG